MKLLINEIEIAAQEVGPKHIHGYKVSVFDVSEKTASEFKAETGEDFEADCSHVKYEICFVDECGVRRALVLIGFEENVIDEGLGDEESMISAGFAKDE